MSIFMFDNTNNNIHQNQHNIHVQTPNGIRRMDEPFPVKLHRLLEDLENTKGQEIISWNPDGKSFTIFQPKAFAESIMGKYFRQTKYKSFQRQMNLYGFSREVCGKIRGVYSHSQFHRNDRDLCSQIKRSNRSRPFEGASSNASAATPLKKSVFKTGFSSAAATNNSIDCSGPLFTTMPTIVHQQQQQNNNNDNRAFNLAMSLVDDNFKSHLSPVTDFSIFASQLNTNNAFAFQDKAPSFTLPAEGLNNPLFITKSRSNQISLEDDNDSIGTIDELPNTTSMNQSMNQASTMINRRHNLPPITSFPSGMDDPEELCAVEV